MAFNSASLGYVHAMAHQLGGFYNLPHGVCNAVLLPSVQEYNAKFVPELFIDIAQAMGIKDVGEDKDEAVKQVLAEIRYDSSLMVHELVLAVYSNTQSSCDSVSCVCKVCRSSSCKESCASDASECDPHMIAPMSCLQSLFGQITGTSICS